MEHRVAGSAWRVAIGVTLLAMTTLTACSSGGGSGKASPTSAAKLSPTKTPTICVDQYLSAAPADDAVAGLQAEVRADGYPNAKWELRNPDSSPNAQQAIVQQFLGDDCTVIASATTTGTQSFMTSARRIPMVWCCVSTPSQAGIMQSVDAPGGNATGVQDPIPVNQEIDALLKIDPKVKRIGIIWKSGDAVGQVLADQAQAHIKSLGLTAVPAPVTTIAQVGTAAQSLIGKVDAIELPGDPTTIAGAPAAVKIAETANIPVFGATTSAVKAGGLLAAAYDYTEMGHLWGKQLVKILNGANPSTTPVITTPIGKILVNKATLSALGLSVPNDMTNVELQ